MQNVRFRAKFVRRLPDPVFPRAERHILLCRVEDVPANIPKDPNPREQRIDRSIWREIEEHLLNEDGTPDTFHLKNKGITMIASSVDKLDDDECDVLFEPGDGIVDGGHTYELISKNQNRIAARNRDGGAIRQFVKIEILTGIEPALAAEIAGGLNTAVQVQAMSLENLRGKFDWIREVLRDEPYFGQIAWRENETKPYDARDIVALLDLFNTIAFPNDGTEYPLRTYTKKASVLEYYCEHTEEYEALKPLVKDILRLHDIISQEARDLHNETGGRAGNLSFVETSKDEFEFHFSGETGKNRLARAALLPMLGAFRWMVEIDEESGVAKWREPFEDVVELWRRVGADLMRTTQTTSVEYGRKAHAIGRSRNHWSTVHGKVVTANLIAERTSRAIRIKLPHKGKTVRT